MDLIQITKIVKEKEKTRDKILGQKEMLMNSLKEMGFKTLEEAKKELTKKEKSIEKRKEHYAKGEKTFKSKFEHLLYS